MPSALELSIEAMNSAADRLPRVDAHDFTRAYAATGEALFWLGVVREELWTNHRDAYEAILEQQSGGFDSNRENMRQRIFGLWHVRDRIAHEVDVIEYVGEGETIDGDPRGFRTLWRWRSLPPLAVAKPDPLMKKKYDGYVAVVAGKDVYDTIVRVLSFLKMIEQRSKGPARFGLGDQPA